MSERELICIGCPMGCPIVVKMEDGKVVSVTGNTCPRGEAYARKEVTDPTRIVTTTVHIGDIVLENVAGTGVNIVAAGNVDAVH